MNTVATIDFETSSRQDVRKVGSHKYASDPTTGIICLCYEIDGGPVKLWVPGILANFPSDLYSHIEAGGILEAHNVGFERAIWMYQMVRKYEAPIVPFSNWDCTAARSAAMGLPMRLEFLGDILNLPIKKDMTGHHKMMAVSRPKFPKKNDPKYYDYPPGMCTWRKDRETLKATYQYCKDDVRSENCLSKRVLPLSKFEKKIWLLDQKANDRGITIDRKAVEIILQKIRELEDKKFPEFSKITNGNVTAPGQVQKIKDWICKRGIKIPNVQAETVETFLKKKLPKDVRKLLELRVFFGGSAVKKYKTMLACMCQNNRIHDTLVYCGAQRTGRWAGRRAQPQNLFRSLVKNEATIDLSFRALYSKNWSILELIYGDLLTAFASMTRHVLIPAEGHEMFCADFSSIETCFLFWLADDSMLEDIRRGKDIYCLMASKVFGKRYGDVTDDERQFGKILILGLGYGMGEDKFLEGCREKGIMFSEEFIRNSVKLYRSEHPRIVGLWRQADKAFKQTLITGKTTSIAQGHLTFRHQGNRITVTLPSQRDLHYWDPKIVKKRKKFKITKYVRDTETGQRVKVTEYKNKIVDSIKVKGVGKSGNFVWEDTYGAKIIQNTIQAGCRDLMAESMLRVKKKKYHILWTTHDEIISEKQIGTGSLEEYCAIMSISPSWAADCPVKADGWKGNRYRK